MIRLAAAAASSSSSSGRGGGKKNLSASERERREEEKRRLVRADDVVLGKTSAIQGAKDYTIDPDATEREWLRQASNVEQAIFRETGRGMELLKMLRLEEAAEAFDRVFELKPNAYLWQAGIVKFYLGELEEAADIFARSAAIYECKFGDPASEERTWRYACELKLLSSMSKKKRKEVMEAGGLGNKLTHLPDHDNLSEFLKSDTRKVARTAREMFEATVAEDDLSVILNRAKLRSIGGAFEDKPVMDRKMWKLNSWYFLGLHYDVLGNEDESKKCMKMALRLCPSAGNGNDIIHTLPLLHMSRRDWFNDDEFEESLGASHGNISSRSPKTAGVDPIVADSIMSNLFQMRHCDLKDALKARRLGVVGSKEELVDRLFNSLMSDTDLMP